MEAKKTVQEKNCAHFLAVFSIEMTTVASLRNSDIIAVQESLLTPSVSIFLSSKPSILLIPNYSRDWPDAALAPSVCSSPGRSTRNFICQSMKWKNWQAFIKYFFMFHSSLCNLCNTMLYTPCLKSCMHRRDACFSRVRVAEQLGLSNEALWLKIEAVGALELTLTWGQLNFALRISLAIRRVLLLATFYNGTQIRESH